MFKKINPYLCSFATVNLVFLLLAFILSVSFLTANKEVTSFIIRFTGDTGGTFFGTRLEVLGAPFIGLLVFIINSSLSLLFYNRHRRLALFTSFAGALIALLILIHIGVIISVN